MNDPMATFRAWFDDAVATSPQRHPTVCCLATVDPDGSPEARFVELKEITPAGLVFTTHLDGPKARALAAHRTAALTFWWDHTRRQVRITGVATPISDTHADRLFAARPRDAQITSHASRQGAPLDSVSALEHRTADLARAFAGSPVPRPAWWGGYTVAPQRMEFLSFRDDRLHERLLFVLSDGEWRRQLLQP